MNMEPLPRRNFLKLATVSAASITAAMLYIGNKSSPKDSFYADQYGKFLSLTTSQAETLFAFIEIAIPLEKSETPETCNAVLRRIDEELTFVNAQIQGDLGMALDALSYIPIVYGKFSRFEKMLKKDRSMFIQSLRNTTNETIRAIVNNCRILTLYIYYGQHESWNSIGYDGSYSQRPLMISEQRVYYSSKTIRRIL